MDQDDLVKKELEKNKEAADKALQDAIATVTSKSLQELNPENKEFLYSRRDYLTREQRDTYRGVFKEVEAWHKEKAEREAREAVNENQNSVNPNPHPGEEDDGQDEVQG